MTSGFIPRDVTASISRGTVHHGRLGGLLFEPNMSVMSIASVFLECIILSSNVRDHNVVLTAL